MMRFVKNSDAASICSIYNHHVLYTDVTFEEDKVSAEEMRKRFDVVRDAGYPWLVWEEAGEVAAYAYVAPYHKRFSYRYTLETTIYVGQQFVGRGIGRRLYQDLIDRLGAYHALIAVITLPNNPSVALHEKMGFSQVGHMREVGWKFDRWIDVGYWQLTLGD